jgi:hypothetical protein
MHRMLLLIPVLCCPITLAAQSEATSRLMTARSLKCEFGPGSQAEWKKGVLTVSSGRFGPPGGRSTIH